MRRKIAAAFGLALLSVVVFDAFYIFMASQLPKPIQGLAMVSFGFWMVYMVTMLLRTVTRPADKFKLRP